MKARHEKELNDLRTRMQKEIDQTINELKMSSDIRRMQAIETQVIGLFFLFYFYPSLEHGHAHSCMQPIGVQYLCSLYPINWWWKTSLIWSSKSDLKLVKRQNTAFGTHSPLMDFNKIFFFWFQNMKLISILVQQGKLQEDEIKRVLKYLFPKK